MTSGSNRWTYSRNNSLSLETICFARNNSLSLDTICFARNNSVSAVAKSKRPTLLHGCREGVSPDVSVSSAQLRASVDAPALTQSASRAAKGPAGAETTHTHARPPLCSAVSPMPAPRAAPARFNTLHLQCFPMQAPWEPAASGSWLQAPPRFAARWQPGEFRATLTSVDSATPSSGSEPVFPAIEARRDRHMGRIPTACLVRQENATEPLTRSLSSQCDVALKSLFLCSRQQSTRLRDAESATRDPQATVELGTVARTRTSHRHHLAFVSHGFAIPTRAAATRTLGGVPQKESLGTCSQRHCLQILPSNPLD